MHLREDARSKKRAFCVAQFVPSWRRWGGVFQVLMRVGGRPRAAEAAEQGRGRKDGTGHPPRPCRVRAADCARQFRRRGRRNRIEQLNATVRLMSRDLGNIACRVADLEAIADQERRLQSFQKGDRRSKDAKLDELLRGCRDLKARLDRDRGTNGRRLSRPNNSLRGCQSQNWASWTDFGMRQRAWSAR